QALRAGLRGAPGRVAAGPPGLEAVGAAHGPQDESADAESGRSTPRPLSSTVLSEGRSATLSMMGWPPAAALAPCGSAAGQRRERAPTPGSPVGRPHGRP